MNTEIKKYADSGDLKSLKYIFVDSLDVDPTFVRYEEEYNYCKSIPGLLEAYVELTPFTFDESNWTEAYWTSLKMDLIKNFSDQRMTHMREVAKVFLADKVQRILAERASAVPSTPEALKNEPVPENVKAPTVETQPEPKTTETVKQPKVSKAAEQARLLEEAKRNLEEENRAAEATRQREAKERAAREQQRRTQEETYSQTGDGVSKKAVGIAVAAVAVAAVILILLLK